MKQHFTGTLRCLECDCQVDIPQPNGTPVCTPCWICMTRLQRMCFGYERDVYTNRTDDADKIVSVETERD